MNYEDAYNWLYNNFIQLYSWGNITIDYYDFNFKDCPYLKYEYINRNLIFTDKDEPVNFIIDRINNGYYVYIFVNTKAISLYGPEHDGHDMFIYGYDDKEKLIYIADNFTYNKYELKTCTFTEFNNSVYLGEKVECDWKENLEGIHLLKFNNLYQDSLNTGRIRLSLKDYIDSVPTNNWFTRICDPEDLEEHLYGINCYKNIMKHLDILKYNSMKQYDFGMIQSIYTMWEHKYIMIKRLQLLNDSRLLSNADNYILIYKNIEKNLNIAKSLVFKSLIKNDIELFSRMNDLYKKAEEMEKDLIPHIIHDIVV